MEEIRLISLSFYTLATIIVASAIFLILIIIFGGGIWKK